HDKHHPQALHDRHRPRRGIVTSPALAFAVCRRDDIPACREMDMSFKAKITAVAIVLQAIAKHGAAAAPDAGFTAFIASLWPEAQAEGVARATFDAETRGLEPDYKLPDLILPGRPATGAPSQAEFVQVPADYLKEASIARLAQEGQRLMAKYRPALTGIEQRFGVPAPIVLAIWGRETDFGRYTLPYDGLRVLATQA